MAALKARGRALIQEVYGSREKAVVFGEGSLEAGLMLVGEAPGEQEALQGRPFVGKAGRYLDGFLNALGVKREHIWITNIVKFRPVKVHPRTGSLSNRPPTREEVELCFNILLSELEIIQPKVVVTLGNVALKAACGDRHAVIGSCHGRPVETDLHGNRFILFPLYHPASIIYNRELASTYEGDLAALKGFLADAGITAPGTGPDGAQDPGVQPVIAEFITLAKVTGLAMPSNLRLGRELFQGNCVEISESAPALAVAQVTGGQRRRVEFIVTEKGLEWTCTCLGKRREVFCKHCVALALALGHPEPQHEQ
jgi:DNA polymerase